MTKLNPIVEKVTNRIKKRSEKSRQEYLAKILKYKNTKPNRLNLSCGNLAHGFAACPATEKEILKGDKEKNFAIISAYSDMLSAHAPYKNYPDIIKAEIKKYGAIAQFAGGVPAMCDGVTQGQEGMELSLFSREVIAMASAIALSHNMFDGVFMLGICDKIVPGMLMGALSFGYLPTIFIPAGPMKSGIPNKEKAKIRELFAAGKISKKELLEAESKSYHSQGTCSFYGTANSNQMMLEVMGLQLPNSSFINPDDKNRDNFTKQAVRIMAENKTPIIADIVNEKSIVNAIIALLASGGSTNLTLHIPAIANIAGIKVTWQDFSDLSDITPLLTKIYPNGTADINDFQKSGGVGFLIKELLNAGLMHADVKNILNEDLTAYIKTAPKQSLNDAVLRPYNKAFSKTGGLKLLTGNLGEAIIKISAVQEKHRYIKAPAIVFNSQDELETEFKKGNLNEDFVAIIRFQGARANGMPELHKLTPILGILQNQGFKIALITDGRMSGASGKIPAAIHVSPEALAGGNIGKIKTGDIIELDANNAKLELLVTEKELKTRKTPKFSANNQGMGRELFEILRNNTSPASQGASVFLSSI